MRRYSPAALVLVTLVVVFFGPALFRSKASGTFNSPPVASSDSYYVHDGIFIYAPGVLYNDSDPDGDAMTVTTGSFTTSHGSGYFYSTGGVQFSPTGPVSSATDTATYTVCDTSSACSTATVTFNITNSAPSVSSKSYTFHGGMDTATDGRPSLLNGATDSDGDSIGVDYKSFSTSIGTGTLWSNGRVQFVTNNGSHGSDSTSYTACDALGLCSSSTVTFNAYNNDPTPAVDSYVVVNGYMDTAEDGQPKTLANDSDPDSDSIGVQAGSFSGSNGSGYFWATGRVQYTPASGFYGTDIHTYTVEDTFGATGTATAHFDVLPIHGHANLGECCVSQPSRGEPVNVTNGNMFLKQLDYALPGFGEPIRVSRFYNSQMQSAGLFGIGWTTQYDTSVSEDSGGKMMTLNLPNGKISLFCKGQYKRSICKCHVGCSRPDRQEWRQHFYAYLY